MHNADQDNKMGKYRMMFPNVAVQNMPKGKKISIKLSDRSGCNN